MSQMKGILLSGGAGTRLHPATKAVSKQLLMVYDKPMVYYSMSVLMLTHVKEVLLVSDPGNIDLYRKLFGDGSDLGMRIEYCVQEEPKGIGQAFILGEEFIGDDPSMLVLGDNMFYGPGLSAILKSMAYKVIDHGGAAISAYKVTDPERYGIVHFRGGKAYKLEEKPQHPKSNFAVPGLYFYDNKVVEIAKNLKPSHRGELEITDINKFYLQNSSLHVKEFPRGFAWLDTGTVDSMLESSNYVQAVEKRQGFKIACLEEIAWKNGWIDAKQVREAGKRMKNSDYGQYLLSLVEGLG